jgi:glyoxylase-like metal-dependent hydrolase (beta-lactamase superfamily II)
MQTITRRRLLRSAVRSTALIPFFPVRVTELIAAGWQQKPDPLAERRAQIGSAPIETTKLAENLVMLSGPGGNVIVLNGPDGKLVVDSFVLPAWPKLKQSLDGMGTAPIKTLIDTHWHFDHADNNENFRKAGAAIVAHVNTKKRLSEAHDLLGMHFAPAPVDGLPTQTFADVHRLQMNGEAIEVGYIPPAHTDTDVYIRFSRANALHLGDVFFNGVYPFIDASTGGSIDGQIAGATLALKLSDSATKIVPGHRSGGRHGCADEVPRHDGDGPRSGTEAQDRRPHAGGGGCRQADRRSGRYVGQGIHAAGRLRHDRVQHASVARCRPAADTPGSGRSFRQWSILGSPAPRGCQVTGHDRRDHFALPHHGAAGRRRHGGRLPGRGCPVEADRRAEVSPVGSDPGS